jgi:hypothetical protein
MVTVAGVEHAEIRIREAAERGGDSEVHREVAAMDSEARELAWDLLTAAGIEHPEIRLQEAAQRGGESEACRQLSRMILEARAVLKRRRQAPHYDTSEVSSDQQPRGRLHSWPNNVKALPLCIMSAVGNCNQVDLEKTKVVGRILGALGEAGVAHLFPKGSAGHQSVRQQIAEKMLDSITKDQAETIFPVLTQEQQVMLANFIRLGVEAHAATTSASRNGPPSNSHETARAAAKVNGASAAAADKNTGGTGS